MDKISRIEREHFDCPEIDCKDHITYPLVSEAEFEFMEFYVSPHKIFLFTYFRELREICFIDIYIYRNRKNYTRYIIRDGYRLAYKEEMSLITYLHGRNGCLQGQIMHAFFLAKSRFPKWSLSLSQDYEQPNLLERMYFSSHKAGAREILYKAGLCSLAEDLDKYPYINLNGTNPEEIFSNGMSLKMLRVLNNLPLRQTRDLDTFKDIYMKFSDYFGKEIPNSSQWAYLTELTLDPSIFSDEYFSFAKQGFKRKIYNRLKHSVRNRDLDKIREYYKLIEENPKFKRRKLPENIYREVDIISAVINDKNRDELVSRWKKEHSTYEFSDSIFEVVMPQNIMDFYKEHSEQKNCVMDYVESHATSLTTILFLRRKTNLDHSFVTMEIRNGILYQALACCNKKPPKEVYEFLIDYTIKKDFAIAPHMTEEIENALKLQKSFWKTTAPEPFENDFPIGLF